MQGACTAMPASATAAARRAACWNSVSLPVPPPTPSARYCFGCSERLSGHRRVPLPPARITGTTVRAVSVTAACLPWSARSLRSAEICDRSATYSRSLRARNACVMLQALADAGRRQHVQVAELAVAALEVLRLDPALGEQRLQQVVGFAEADAERARELALRVLGVLLEQAQQRDGSVFVGGGSFRVQRRLCSMAERSSVPAVGTPAKRRKRRHLLALASASAVPRRAWARPGPWPRGCTARRGRARRSPSAGSSQRMPTSPLGA